MQNPPAKVSEADKARARKHWKKAVEYYFDHNPKTFKEARAAIALHPNWSRPHWLLGAAYMLIPPINREAAIREYRQVVRKEPSWSTGHLCLGTKLAEQGRVDEGIASLREALRLKPDCVYIRAELSRWLLVRNEYLEAITVMRGKPSLSPFYTSADAYLLRAEAIHNSGHHTSDLKREAWEEILRLDSTIPANRAAQEQARKRLSEITP